ncbi:dodecin family protein [Ornithinimicrobium tianjinense]
MVALVRWAEETGPDQHPTKEVTVSNHVYKVAEVVGTFPDGIQQAITNAISTTARTVRHLDWFEVTEVRGHLVDGAVADWQVGVKVGFRVED